MSAPAEWLWMQRTFGIGTTRAHLALERCGRPDEILALSARRLAQDNWLSPREKQAIASPDLAAAEELLKQAQALGFSALTPDSPEYPARLRSISAIPLVLYAKGDRSLLAEPYPIAMVGSREPDEYGCRAARKIATEIAGTGGVVVSGLARGIDTVCHEAALAVGGKTIGVLAAGPDSAYPRASLAIRDAVGEHGLLLSEFPVGCGIRPHSFHVRNRLLSGLSLAAVVVQAARRSGALITAGHALAQDRDVFAVCGDLFSRKMEGCHDLLCEGAAPIFSGVQLLKDYEAVYGIPLEPVADGTRIAALANPVGKRAAQLPERPAAKPARPAAPVPAPRRPAPAILASLTETQDAVYTACAAESGFDELCERTMLETASLLSALTQLEIFGLIEELPGRRFRQVKP